MGNEILPSMMKYCVVGNIVKERVDENGVIRCGTASFPGGRKVYISKYYWNNCVTVMGLNRFKRYRYEDIPLAWIENIRPARTFKHAVLERMTNTDEYPDMWWLYREEDRAGAYEYARLLNHAKATDEEIWDEQM